MATYKFTGTVIDKETGQTIPGQVVEAWDKDEKDNNLLGTATTKAKGRFVIEFDDVAFSNQGKV